MLKRIFLLFALVALAGLVFAQPSAEERAKRQTDMMKDVLKLNDDQVKKVEKINVEYMKKMDEARGKEGDARQEAMREANKVRGAAFRDVLTPEQMETWRAKQKEMAEEMKKKGGKKQ